MITNGLVSNDDAFGSTRERLPNKTFSVCIHNQLWEAKMREHTHSSQYQVKGTFMETYVPAAQMNAPARMVDVASVVPNHRRFNASAPPFR